MASIFQFNVLPDNHKLCEGNAAFPPVLSVCFSVREAWIVMFPKVPYFTFSSSILPLGSVLPQAHEEKVTSHLHNYTVAFEYFLGAHVQLFCRLKASLRVAFN